MDPNILNFMLKVKIGRGFRISLTSGIGSLTTGGGFGALFSLLLSATSLAGFSTLVG
jgi:hypothetical protein